MKKVLLYIVLLLSAGYMGAIPPSFVHPYHTDIVVFSYDRPMQLDALLRGVKNHVTGTNKISVIYRASGDEFSSAYSEIRKEFSTVQFLHQKEVKDFKPLLMSAIKNTTARYMTFVADDIVIKDDISLVDCAYWIERTGAHGYYLRLGNHLTACYPHDCSQEVPEHTQVSGDVHRWNFADGKYDWNCPNNIDMTLYPTSYIVPLFESLSFDNPNELEAVWAAKKPQKTFGLFFEDSKIVNIPLNLVNDSQENRNMNAFSKKELLEKYNKGERIDIVKFNNIKNNGAHTPYQPTFISSEDQEVVA